jgi:hypothetical protein
MPIDDELLSFTKEFRGLWYCIVPDNYSSNMADFARLHTACIRMFTIGDTYRLKPLVFRRLLYHWLSIYRLVKEHKFYAKPSIYNQNLELRIITFDDYVNIITEITDDLNAYVLAQTLPRAKLAQNVVNYSKLMASYIITGSVIGGEQPDVFHVPDVQNIEGLEILKFLLLDEAAYRYVITHDASVWFDNYGFSDIIRRFRMYFVSTLFIHGYDPNGVGLLNLCLYRRLNAFAYGRLAKVELVETRVPHIVIGNVRILTNFVELFTMWYSFVNTIRDWRANGLMSWSIDLLPYRWFINELERGYLIIDQTQNLNEVT